MCVCVFVFVVTELLLCFVSKVGTFTSPVLVLDVGPYSTLEHYLECVCVCLCVHAQVCVCARRCVDMGVGVVLEVQMGV